MKRHDRAQDVRLEEFAGCRSEFLLLIWRMTEDQPSLEAGRTTLYTAGFEVLSM